MCNAKSGNHISERNKIQTLFQLIFQYDFVILSF